MKNYCLILLFVIVVTVAASKVPYIVNSDTKEFDDGIAPEAQASNSETKDVPVEAASLDTKTAVSEGENLGEVTKNAEETDRDATKDQPKRSSILDFFNNHFWNIRDHVSRIFQVHPSHPIHVEEESSEPPTLSENLPSEEHSQSAETSSEGHSESAETSSEGPQLTEGTESTPSPDGEEQESQSTSHFFNPFSFLTNFLRPLIIPFTFNPFSNLGSNNSESNLPPHQANHTSEVHDINGSKVKVDQSIYTSIDNGTNDSFIFKVINVVPQDESDADVADVQKDNNAEGSEQSLSHEENRIKVPDQEPLITEYNHIKVVSQEPIATKTNKIRVPDQFDDHLNEIEDGRQDYAEKYNENLLNNLLRRKKRSIEVGIPGDAIKFPPNDVNQFPHSFINNKNIRSEDLKSLLSDSKSKSYVYKNIGGKPIFYIVNHSAKQVDSSTLSNKNPDAESFGPVREPDLSRDTLVNPSGGDNEQQGLIQVDPDAEIFDLNLLIKEIESRPKH